MGSEAPVIRALTPLTHPVIMGQGEVDRCSGANSCRRLVAAWLSGVQWAGGQGQGPQTLLCPPHSLWGRRWCVGRRCWAVLGALGLLAGAGFGSWLLGQYWDLQWLGEGQERILGVLGERNRK